MDNFNNSQEGIQEKGKHSFLYSHSIKKKKKKKKERIEFNYELLLEFDLIDAEDVRCAEEQRDL